jgi:hypothetical protein
MAVLRGSAVVIGVECCMEYAFLWCPYLILAPIGLTPGSQQPERQISNEGIINTNITIFKIRTASNARFLLCLVCSCCHSASFETRNCDQLRLVRHCRK